MSPLHSRAQAGTPAYRHGGPNASPRRGPWGCGRGKGRGGRGKAWGRGKGRGSESVGPSCASLPHLQLHTLFRVHCRQDPSAKDIEKIDALSHQSVQMMQDVGDEEYCTAVYGDSILDAFTVQSMTGATVSLFHGADKVGSCVAFGRGRPSGECVGKCNGVPVHFVVHLFFDRRRGFSGDCWVLVHASTQDFRAGQAKEVASQGGATQRALLPGFCCGGPKALGHQQGRMSAIQRNTHHPETQPQPHTLQYSEVQ